MNKERLSKKLLLTIITLCIFLTNCKKPSQLDNTNPKLAINSDSLGINILWNNVERISGGNPLMQGKEIEIEAIGTTQEAASSLTHFLVAEDTVSVKSDIYSDKNAVVISISTNGLQSKNGADYVGLFFDTFPKYKEGIASYLFGDWESWTKPVKVSDPKNTLPEKLLFHLFKYTDGTYGAMMPLGGNGYNATLGSQQQKFGARSVSYKDGFEAKNVPLMAISFGTDPYETVKNLYESGMKAMGKENGLRKNKTYPKIFESIGWCSWNALGEDVSEQKLMEAVGTFSDNDFQLPFMLIDDGWLSINNNKQLTSFAFDKEKFPNGFKAGISRLKEIHGIKDIGVWHTMNGYWSGVEKEQFQSDIQQNLMPYLDKAGVHDDSLSSITYHTPSALSNTGESFYDNWYAYLKEQGINFVKVDQQSVIKRVAKGQMSTSDRLPFWDIAQQKEQNLQNAIAKHFNGAVINCQDMATEAVYNFTTSAIGRNSDDFFPERTAYFSLEVEKGNAAAHVLMNVHNSLWYSNMVWPDFDMFQSHHRDAEYHAISRAISGGPIYLTDTPGQQNFEILKQLTFKDGEILRPDVPALPTEDCLFQINDKKPFKSFSKVDNNGILGIWNTDDADEVSGTFSPSDINGLKGSDFAVYDYFNKTVALLKATDTTSVNLKRKGYKLFTMVPLEHQMAAIGLLNKYISPKAIIKKHIDSEHLEVTLIQGGTFGAFLPKSPYLVQINGKPVAPNTWKYHNQLFQLEIPEKMESVTVKITL